MSFVVIVPARLASTRLPNKPILDVGGVPMVVRVAQQAMRSGANRVVVAADHDSILAACALHGIEACLTSCDHISGTDRIAQAASMLGLADDDIVVNVQGDEPFIAPELIAASAALIQGDVLMATAAYAIEHTDDAFNPNIVKVVLNKMGHALYFSRATIPWHRDGFAQTRDAMPAGYAPLRHIGLYAYRNSFLQAYPKLAPAPLEQIEMLEQLRALWHGFVIAVHVTSIDPGIGVDTPDDLIRARAFFAQ